MPPASESAYSSPARSSASDTRPGAVAAGPGGGGSGRRRGQAPGCGVAHVAVEVGALQAADLGAPIDVPTDHRAAAVVVVVLVDRWDRTRRRAAVEATSSFQPVPAEVRAGGPAQRDGVDLLHDVLADVADPKVAGGAVEREAPRVAQAKRPDLGAGAPPAHERVVGGHLVALAAGRRWI